MFKILERFRKSEYSTSENDVRYIVLDWNASVSTWSRKIDHISHPRVCLLFKDDYDWTNDLQPDLRCKLLDLKQKIYDKKHTYFVVLSYGNGYVNPPPPVEETLPKILNNIAELHSVFWYGLQNSGLKERVRAILSQLLENHYEHIYFSLITTNQKLMKDCEAQSIIETLKNLYFENPGQISAMWQKIATCLEIAVQIIEAWLSQADVLESIINQLTDRDTLSLRAILVPCIDKHFREESTKNNLCIAAEIGGTLTKYTGAEIYNLAEQEGKLHRLIYAMSDFEHRAEAARTCLMEHLKKKKELVNSIIQADISIEPSVLCRQLPKIVTKDDNGAIKRFFEENVFPEEHNTFRKQKELEFFIEGICADEENFTTFVNFCLSKNEDILSDLRQREDFKEIVYAWLRD